MSETAFNTYIKTSRRLRSLLVMMHLLAISAVWLANLAMLVQLLLTAVITLSGGYYWMNVLPASSDSELLRYFPLDGWQLANNKHPLMPIEIQQCFISRPLLIINFRQAGRRDARLILNDSVEPDAFRKLRILLRQTA